MMHSFRSYSQSVLLVLALVVGSSIEAKAQSSFGDSSILMILLLVLGVILAVVAILSVTDNFMQLEAQKAGIDIEKENFSIFPSYKEIFAKKKPRIVGDDGYTKLDKGFNILLEGLADGSIKTATGVNRYAVRPIDFRGISPIPKVMKAVGDEIKAGEVLFFDKKDDRIKYVAPVSGEIVEIVRGAKRAITDVVILADKEISHLQHDVPSIKESDRKTIVQFLLDAGAWTLFNKRPYDVLPNPESTPRDIFVSTFDSAPLSMSYNEVVKGQEQAFQTGIDVLNRLTEGTVYLGLDAKDENVSSVFTTAKNVSKHWFEGKHPAGNVGTQIHHIAPINAGDEVWTIDVQSLLTLGHLFTKGIWDSSRVVAITGAELKQPELVRTYAGASVGDLLKNNLKDGHIRIIDGNVLTGKKSDEDQFLSHLSEQITVVEEGDDYELFGWLLPIEPRPSYSNTFPNFLYPEHRFEANTNTHGEKRAFVMSGQYEAVMPMDIYPQHLMKAIMAGDFERMEGLGINELSEEDVALCEFVCTSKMPLQEILRDGLDMMREQG